MMLAKYLGKTASCLLESEPFERWPVERLVDTDSDPPTVGYIFVGCGLQFNCDTGSERIRSIFLEKGAHGGTPLSGIPFTMKRKEVLAYIGIPSESGEQFSDPILGEFGAWDRFEMPDHTLHIQYKANSGDIDKVTLMLNDVVPE
jgi:hypothetical protein